MAVRRRGLLVLCYLKGDGGLHVKGRSIETKQFCSAECWRGVECCFAAARRTCLPAAGPSGHHDGSVLRAVWLNFVDSLEVAVAFSSGEMAGPSLGFRLLASCQGGSGSDDSSDSSSDRPSPAAASLRPVRFLSSSLVPILLPLSGFMALVIESLPDPASPTVGEKLVLTPTAEGMLFQSPAA
ncbi:multiple RNA-binding domain-containing protein 1 [Striga asiatica]|uniref:Multiple RNA-binding domain-containing protein 1 n=1 Tax=Striga asiatica TaxID=4170 RepID=A0A5A7QDF7_STRAF|nr:multiple RNA-binding domain-containing protein 1 [Striga asiatica]